MLWYMAYIESKRGQQIQETDNVWFRVLEYFCKLLIFMVIINTHLCNRI